MTPAVNEFRVILKDPSDNEVLVMKVRLFAEQIGFCQTDQFLLATAVSELGTNIIRYAKGGEIAVRAIRREGGAGVEIIAKDQGRGIADVDIALQEGFSTCHGSLGMGLPTVKRLSDEFHIKSEIGKGVCICARFWVKHVASGHTSGSTKP